MLTINFKKKIFILLFIFFFHYPNNSFSSISNYYDIGKGDINLDSLIIETFVDYVKKKGVYKHKYPLLFAVAEDSSGFWVSYCPSGSDNCEGLVTSRDVIKNCEAVSKSRCYVFAEKRRVVWQNSKFVKPVTISSRDDDEKIKNILLNMGFINSFNNINNRDGQKSLQPIAENKNNKVEIIVPNKLKITDSSYVLSGRVKASNLDKVFLTVNNKIVPISNGLFSVERFTPENEIVSIIATDQWGNRTSKNIQIEIDNSYYYSKNNIAPLNPKKIIKTKDSGYKVAIILGLEKYKNTSDAKYADNDARYFYEYAKNLFGIPKQNIKILTNENASLVEIISTFTKWLPSKVIPNKTEVIIFYAGHGLASPEDKNLYLLPYDGDVDLLNRTAISKQLIINDIARLKPKRVKMFLDTCFSGPNREGESLLSLARPIQIIANAKLEIPSNFEIFSAAQNNEIALSFDSAKHGLFSYYLMKGLEGDADSNKNEKIDSDELLNYLSDNVKKIAIQSNKNQNPNYYGKSKSLIVNLKD